MPCHQILTPSSQRKLGSKAIGRKACDVSAELLWIPDQVRDDDGWSWSLVNFLLKPFHLRNGYIQQFGDAVTANVWPLTFQIFDAPDKAHRQIVGEPAWL